MAQVNSVYERWNGSAWVELLFRTSADNVLETATLKVMTADERTAIATYLVTFNAANKLLKLDASALVPTAQLPDLGATYLKRIGGSGNAMGGDLWIGGYKLKNDDLNYIEQTGQYLNIKIDAYDVLQMGGGAADFKTQVLRNLGNPTQAQDAATKSWVEGLVSVGAHPAPGGAVQIATTSNYASFPTTGPITIDGVQFLTADGQTIRVLVKNQSTVSQNGIYTVARVATNVVSWTKVTADSTQGTLVFVEYGSTQNDWMFHNTDGTTWTSFTKTDTVVADEVTMTKSGQTFSIKAGGIGNNQIGASAGIVTSKLANEVTGESTAWASMEAVGTSNALSTKLANLFSAIKLLRGEANYNTNNTKSIAGAYTQLDQLIPNDFGCVGYLLSTANIATLSGTQTVDSTASGTDGKLIILVGQTTASQNGVYRTAAGAWTKLAGLMNKAYYVATAGSANINKVYRGGASDNAVLTYDGSGNIPVGMAIISYA